MKCQNLFSAINRKNISNCHIAEFISSMLCIKTIFTYILLTANSYILVTGGDDNAIQVSLIIIEDSVVTETDSERKVKVICTGSVPSAHAAQITG